jgi:hypothetical protein
MAVKWHESCHLTAIVGGAFVANLSVCYFLWGLSGEGSGTSVTIFHAGHWLDYGNV